MARFCRFWTLGEGNSYEILDILPFTPFSGYIANGKEVLEVKNKTTFWTLVGIYLALSPNSSSAEPYGSGWYKELQFGFGYENNISRSFYSPDEVSDEIATVSIGGGHSQKVRDNAQLVFYGYLAVNAHNEYDDLNNLALSFGSTYTIQPTPGYTSFWYHADVSATILRYDNSDAREGVLFNGDFSVNRRLGTRATGRLGYRYNDLVFLGKTSAEEVRDAAFDTATHEIYLGVDYQLTQNLFAYGEYAFKHGGIWSNNSFAAGIIEYDAETIDPVFDECDPNDFRCQPRYAGRTDSDIHRLNAGVAFPIGPMNIDVSAVYCDAEGDNGVEYKDWLLNLGLIWNF